MIIYQKTIASPIGFLSLRASTDALLSISFDGDSMEDSEVVPDLLFQAQAQLEEYFRGVRRVFDLPFDPSGSDFQHRVWNEVSRVAFGTTRSYGEIARALGSIKYSRAVGMGNGKNPLPIVVPCHRIIGQNGKLTGYAGGLDRKKWLLLHEQHYSGSGDQLRIKN